MHKLKDLAAHPFATCVGEVLAYIHHHVVVQFWLEWMIDLMNGDVKMV